MSEQDEHIHTFTAVIIEEDDRFIGWLEGYPGTTLQANTLERLRDDLGETATLMAESERLHAERLATAQQEGLMIRREEIQVATNP